MLRRSRRRGSRPVACSFWGRKNVSTRPGSKTEVAVLPHYFCSTPKKRPSAGSFDAAPLDDASCRAFHAARGKRFGFDPASIQNAHAFRQQETYNHCFIVSFAITLRTSDCGIPNCLAIFAGVTPALKAARTAFCLPIVKVTAGNSVRLLSVFDGSGFLPRRCCSAVTAASSWSSSWSLRCWIAAGRSLRRMCRDDAAEFSTGGIVGVGVSAACSRGGSVEKRLGIIGVIRPLPMGYHAALAAKGQ